jgi:hypothetical protein
LTTSDTTGLAVVQSSNVPSTLTSSLILSVPTSTIFYVSPTSVWIFPSPVTLVVPSSYVSPYIIPVSYLTGTLTGITISSNPSFVIVNSPPTRVPSSVAQSIPQSFFTYLTTPTQVTIPSTFESPVIVPFSAVASLPSTQVVLLTTSGLAVVAWTNVPSSLPSSLILSVPSSTVVTVPTSVYVYVPATVVVPSTWVSPVVVPASYVSHLPSS